MQKLALWTSLVAQKPGDDNQSLWDPYLPVFEQTVSLCAAAVGLSVEDLDRNAIPKTQTPFFSLDIGIVGPLYGVARKCRHPIVRRRAIALLEAAPRQEGFWDGAMAARVAARAVEIEEAGLLDIKECADVPDACRISDAIPIFDYEGRKATVRYVRPNCASGRPREDVVEVFTW